jgi:hypothetical protein
MIYISELNWLSLFCNCCSGESKYVCANLRVDDDIVYLGNILYGWP